MTEPGADRETVREMNPSARRAGSEPENAEAGAEPPLESGDAAWVIEPDNRELARVRAMVSQWLDLSPLDLTARADLQLVVTESVALVLAAEGPRRPIEIRCRYTHSIAIVEVTRTGVEDESLGSVSGDAEGEQSLRHVLLEVLTSRLLVATAAGRATVRCTLSLTDRVDLDGPL